jgi:predicted O-methyltransferase YrrM
MDPSVRQVIDRVEKQDAADREERAAGVVRPPEEGLWALHPDTARLIHIIVQSAGYKKLLEVGVSHGYSTLWLANAARATGGRLTALEDNPASVEIAQQNLEAAGLSGVVDFVLGDARETLQEIEKRFDFVLLDCWDWLYSEILPHVLPVLRPGGLLVTDNVTPGHAS